MPKNANSYFGCSMLNFLSAHSHSQYRNANCKRILLLMRVAWKYNSSGHPLLLCISVKFNNLFTHNLLFNANSGNMIFFVVDIKQHGTSLIKLCKAFLFWIMQFSCPVVIEDLSEDSWMSTIHRKYVSFFPSS